MLPAKLSYTKPKEMKLYFTKSREEEMKDALEKVSRFHAPILDIGASEGKVYEIEKRMKLKNEYIATELNLKLAKNLKRKFKEVEVLQCSAYCLPFREKCVNPISLNVINWIPMEQEKHLEELERISKDLFLISLYSEMKKIDEKLKKKTVFSEKVLEYCRENFKKVGEYKDKIGTLELFIRSKHRRKI
jgi:ubiquinone/menaquinone biosynthesis C-methylase UbiE